MFWRLVRHALSRPRASVTCTTRHFVHCGALRLSFRSRLCRSYVHPRRWKSPFGPLRCISVFPMGDTGCCACVVVRCLCSCPLASRLSPVRGLPRSLCSVSCPASPLQWCVGRCLSAVTGGQGCLAWWHAGLQHSVAIFWAPCRRCRHKCSVIRCPGVQRFRRQRALVLVSQSSLKLLALDISCSQVVCPDDGTPCAVPWVSRDLLPWCMIFSETMRAGSTFIPGPPPWEVKFSRLLCSGVGEPRTARRAGLRVTFPCSPAGAGGLVGAVCWAPGPPFVWLVRKGGQTER